LPAHVRDDVDRELVDLLTGDPAWVRRQFDDIVAAEFPTEPPGGDVSPGSAALNEPARGRGPLTSGPPAGRRHQRPAMPPDGHQRSPPQTVVTKGR
jgi:hypothetical protein